MVQAWQHTGLRSHFDHPGPILHMLTRTEKRDRAWQPAKLFFQVMKDHSDPGSIAYLSPIVRDRQHLGWPNLRESADNRIDRLSHRSGRILRLRLDRANDLHRVRTPKGDLYGGRLVPLRCP